MNAGFAPLLLHVRLAILVHARPTFPSRGSESAPKNPTTEIRPVLLVRQRVWGKPHRGKRRRIELAVGLQSSALLELLHGVLRALAPNSIHGTRIKAQVVEA